MPPFNSRSNNQREAVIRRTTLVGLLLNIVLVLFKLFAGIVGHSSAVIADSFHSLTDVVTDIAVLIGACYWAEPADASHPYGHGRIETLVSLILGASLFVAAGLIAGRSLISLRNQHHSAPGVIALIAAGISLVTKELLYRWTIKQGETVKSPALIANAWHHRSDVFSSIPAFAAVAVALVAPAWSFVDHIGAILVALLITQAALRIGATSVNSLIDRSAPPGVRHTIEAMVREVTGVQCLHAVRTRNLGDGWGVDLHVLVNGELTVKEGHDIAEQVKTVLVERGPDIVDVVVHIEPH